MSISRKTLKLVQKSLPRLHLCGDKLVLPPTEHILRGFRFERTPYKGKFYLWRLIMPLYRYYPLEILNYSERIPKGDYVHLSREAQEQSAAEVTTIISGDLPNLAKIRSPQDFLDHISWMIGNDSPNFLLDLALTYYLVGRFDDAAATLRQTAVEAERSIAEFRRAGYFGSPNIPRLSELRGVADDFAAALKSSPAAAADIIKGWERTNIIELDLADTLSESTRSHCRGSA